MIELMIAFGDVFEEKGEDIIFSYSVIVKFLQSCLFVYLFLSKSTIECYFNHLGISSHKLSSLTFFHNCKVSLGLSYPSEVQSGLL